MTKEEKKRLPYVRDASDPLAWRDEAGVEEDETPWELLSLIPVAQAARFAKTLPRAAARVLERRAAEGGAAPAAREAVDSIVDTARQLPPDPAENPLARTVEYVSSKKPLRVPQARIRESMRLNQEMAGGAVPDIRTKRDLEPILRGRPWPDFLKGKPVPINHKGRTYQLYESGDVLDEEGRRVFGAGVNRSSKGAHHTDATFYSPDVDRTDESISGLGSAVRKKLSEIHGNIASDSGRRTSELAQASWRRADNVYGMPDPRILPGKEKMTAPMFVLKHPDGGAIRRVVRDVENQGHEIDWKEVLNWLVKYGGNAALGTVGLEALRRHLEEGPGK